MGAAAAPRSLNSAQAKAGERPSPASRSTSATAPGAAASSTAASRRRYETEPEKRGVRGLRSGEEGGGPGDPSKAPPTGKKVRGAKGEGVATTPVARRGEGGLLKTGAVVAKASSAAASDGRTYPGHGSGALPPRLGRAEVRGSPKGTALTPPPPHPLGALEERGGGLLDDDVPAHSKPSSAGIDVWRGWINIPATTDAPAAAAIFWGRAGGVSFYLCCKDPRGSFYPYCNTQG